MELEDKQREMRDKSDIEGRNQIKPVEPHLFNFENTRQCKVALVNLVG